MFSRRKKKTQKRKHLHPCRHQKEERCRLSLPPNPPPKIPWNQHHREPAADIHIWTPCRMKRKTTYKNNLAQHEKAELNLLSQESNINHVVNMAKHVELLVKNALQRVKHATLIFQLEEDSFLHVGTLLYRVQWYLSNVTADTKWILLLILNAIYEQRCSTTMQRECHNRSVSSRVCSLWVLPNATHARASSSCALHVYFQSRGLEM